MPSALESNNTSQMLLDMHSKDNDNNLKQIQQKSEQQKAFMDKVALDKMFADQQLFFALMQKLFSSKLQQTNLQEQLEQEAQKSGFTNLKEALNLAKNPEGQSPLQQAFQEQRFEDAQQLIDYGAIPGPVERAAFNIALDSKAAKNFGFSGPKEEEKLHPVKNFGLVLGIEMTSKDGTFSQFGHVGPTYQLMTDAVDKYANSKGTDPGLKEIADAYKFTNQAASFSASTSQRNPEAGKEISDRIQEGKVTTIPISCSGHAMGLSIIPDGPDSKSGYLAFTNKGLGAKPGESGTQIYRVEDLSKLDADFVNSVMNGHSDGVPHSEIMSKISEVTDNQPPVHTIRQAEQKVDNCSIANTRSNIHGIILCQMARDKGGFDKLSEQDLDAGKKEFKKFTDHMKTDKVHELAEAIKKNPNDEDLNQLAQVYLKQNPNAGAHLREPLEKALGSKFQQTKSPSTVMPEEANFLQPPRNSVASLREAIPSQLSAPGNTTATKDLSTFENELSQDEEDEEAMKPGLS